MTQKKQMTNPLGTDRISTLVARFAVPSIIATLVSAVYNIADQLFIGNAVGTLGNAATNVAFPLSMLCASLALLFGIGGASSFNLHMGAGRKEEAPYYIGNSITMLLSLGFLLLLITELFLNPLLVFFGSPADVLPLAEQYVRVTAVGFPFFILTIGSGHLIRADGNPKMAMFVTVSGAVINIVLDALFVFGFQWGIEHIFEGNVRRGKAGGYHYECIKDTAGNIVNGTEVLINDLGVYKAQVEVNGIPKSGNGGYSTFFPKEKSPQDVIDSINEAYNNKVFVVGSKNSYIGISNNGLEIEMYINNNGKIISAFPKE